MRKAATILGCLSILTLLCGSAMADSTETTPEAIFDQAFVDEYSAHLESLYGDVAADLWNEEELKGYEAFLYEIIGPNAKSYVKENFDTYKPLPTIRGGDGEDKICGGNGDHLTQKTDYLYGEGHSDRIWGDYCEEEGDPHCECVEPARCVEGNIDHIEGGHGHDKIYGGIGCDLLLGDDGEDEIYGAIDRDIISGGVGGAWCFGGAPIGGGINEDMVSCDPMSCQNWGNPVAGCHNDCNY
jgi:Ca2+-binding RTX toxin-like protein